MPLLKHYAVIVLVAMAAYGSILTNGAGFSHPDDGAAAQLRCCTFRPLVALTYEVNRAAGGWMLLNFSLHVLASVLLFHCSSSLLAGMLFAAHPMAADAVASVAGRSALVLSIVVLTALLTWSIWPRVAWVFATVGALLSAGFLPSYLDTIQNAQSDWVASYVSALGGYVFLRLAIPIGLSADPFIETSFLAGAVGWCIIVILIALTISRQKPLRLAAILILSSLTPYMLIPLPDVFLEHRAYLAIAGAAVALSYALAHAKVAGYAMVAVFILLAQGRADVYASPVALWEDAAAKAPESFRPHLNLGTHYAIAGNYDGAERAYRTAIGLNPRLEMAWRNLALLYVVQGNLSEASRILDTYDAKKGTP